MCKWKYSSSFSEGLRLYSVAYRHLLIYLIYDLCFRYDYKIAREYNWNVKNKASKGYEENYFFIFRDGDGVYYNELETRQEPISTFMLIEDYILIGMFVAT